MSFRRQFIAWIPPCASTIQTLKERYQSDEFVWLTGLSARLALTFGAMALFLAALGIYAIKGFMVASRTPEIGIRKALGATRRDVIVMVIPRRQHVDAVGVGDLAWRWDWDLPI